MKIKGMKKKYEKPKARALRIANSSYLLAGSPEAGLQGSATLGESWTDSGKDAWDGSSSSGGGGSLGGWTDNGDSAWE